MQAGVVACENRRELEWSYARTVASWSSAFVGAQVRADKLVQ